MINCTIKPAINEGFYVSPKVLKYGKSTSSSRFCEEQARWSESGASGLQIYLVSTLII